MKSLKILLLVLCFFVSAQLYAESQFISVKTSDMKILKQKLLELKVLTINYEKINKNLQTVFTNYKENLQKSEILIKDKEKIITDFQIKLKNSQTIITDLEKSLTTLRQSLISIELKEKIMRYIMYISIPVAIITTAIISGYITYQITIYFK